MDSNRNKDFEIVEILPIYTNRNEDFLKSWIVQYSRFVLGRAEFKSFTYKFWQCFLVLLRLKYS